MTRTPHLREPKRWRGGCVRWSPTGERCLFYFGNHCVDTSRGEPRLAYVFTADKNLRNVRFAVDLSFGRRGVHWGWHPDGEHLIGYGPDPDNSGSMCLVQVACDGSGYRKLSSHHSGGRVSIPKSCTIHPESRISARQGRLSMGERCQVGPGAVLQGNIDMGVNCSVQAYSVLVGYGDTKTRSGLIRIGDNVRIAPHVMMIAGNHNFDDPARLITEQGLTLKPITIEDDIWVAGCVNIMARVTIGRGSVIGFGSQNTLYKAFKRAHGVSQSAYRDSFVKIMARETDSDA